MTPTYPPLVQELIEILIDYRLDYKLLMLPALLVVSLVKSPNRPSQKEKHKDRSGFLFSIRQIKSPFTHFPITFCSFFLASKLLYSQFVNFPFDLLTLSHPQLLRTEQ